MNFQIRFLIAGFFWLFFYADTVWAGWVMTYKDVETGEKSQEFYEGDKVNLGDLIFTDKHIIVVDQGSRAYWQGTPEQYCEALRELKQKMKAQMAALPYEYKPVPINQQKVTREKIGTESIAGYSATGYAFFVDGIQHGEVWVSSDSGLRGLINWEKSMEKDFECFEDDEMEGTTLEESALFQKTTKDVFVLKESYRQVVSIEKKNIAASKFEAPAGYRSFGDYQQFMDHIMSQPRSSSHSSSQPPYSPPSYPEQSMPVEDESSGNGGDNLIVEDAKDVGKGSVDEAHRSTKRGIQKEVSKDIQKEVKGFLEKIF